MVMEPEDLETALSTYGFNMTVTIPAADATGSEITMADDNAVVDASAPGPGFATPVDTDCSVIVQEFCLLNAEEVSTGRW